MTCHWNIKVIHLGGGIFQAVIDEKVVIGKEIRKDGE